VSVDDECEECGAPLNQDEEGSSLCLDCYNDKRMADSSAEVDPDECGYRGSGTDPEVMCSDCWDEMQDRAL
ncbi:MAG: hypothetical protein Q8S20_01740, partial [Sulfuritalea sp.]|nr:hypothetical protein [Sulfuritalea sp.]